MNKNSREFFQYQITLAVAVYTMENGFIDPDLSDEEFDNIIIQYWEENEYSTLYLEIVESPEFHEHPDFLGDIFKLSAEDIIKFKKNKKESIFN